MADPFAAVPAQPAALEVLRAALAHPVHAYLLVGAPGTGTLEAATAFAAALVDPGAGDGARRVAAGIHPDVIVVEREGAAISIDAAREVTRLAARSPAEGARKVLILTDFHLVRDAGPALLKTIEEPVASTVFVILAEYLPPELATIASRCVRVDFAPLTVPQVVAALVADGVAPDAAADLAAAAGGRLDRARLLATDPDFGRRRAAWAAVPARLDGTGATAAVVVDELVALLDASVAPLAARHSEALEALEARNTRAAEVNGKVGRAGRGALKLGVRELEERQRRELRRQRTDELRAGLAVLAAAYRDALVDPHRRTAAVAALAAIDRLGADLVRNPGETLALQALCCRIAAAR